MISATTGLLIIVAVMLIVIIRRQLRQRAEADDARLANSAQELELRLEETADRIVKRMGNHVDHLEVLIAEADEKIAQLDERIRQWEAVSQAKPPEGLPARGKEAKPDRADRPADFGASSLFAAPQGTGGKRKERAPLKLSGVHEKAAAMLKNGRTVDEIARETGLGKGAIFLIQEMCQVKKRDEL